MEKRLVWKMQVVENILPGVSCHGVIQLMQVRTTCRFACTYVVDPITGVHSDHFNALGLCYFGLILKHDIDRDFFSLSGFSNGSAVYQTSQNYETVNVKAQAETAGSSLSLYRELNKARSTPSIMYGTSEFAVIGNNTVFAFTR
jgi:hypothetical protein